MPIYLAPRDVTDELAPYNSALIVSCLMCPPMSIAMQKKQPLIDLFHHGFRMKAFDDYVASIREPLEQRGVRVGSYAKLAPLPFICLWTEGQRKRPLKKAHDYEAVLVLGCNSAQSTVEDVLKDTDCTVIQGMRMAAIANATTKVRLPFKIDLVMQPLKKKRHRYRDTQPGDVATGAEKDEEK